VADLMHLKLKKLWISQLLQLQEENSLSYSKVSANQANVYPAMINGRSDLGYCYFVWADSGTVGAQCSNCQNIVWVDSRKNKILSELKPDDIPDSGTLYQEYYWGKISRFLSSINDCPDCRESDFDLFVNNTTYSRLKNGEKYNVKYEESLMFCDREKIKVWWFE
jgi:hypothetical protein